MVTIQVAHDAPANAVARVETMLAETALRDPDWNGVEFQVERADFTCIDEDSIRAQQLLRDVFAAIDDE